jgi:hypothetical protein
MNRHGGRVGKTQSLILDRAIHNPGISDPGIREAGDPGIRESENPRIRESGNQGIRESGSFRETAQHLCERFPEFSIR